MTRGVLLKTTAASIMALTAIATGLYFWRVNVVAKQERLRYHLAEKRLQDGRALNAIEIIQAQERVEGEAVGSTEKDIAWRKLKIKAMADSGNAAILESLYRRFPAEVSQNEAAALLIARSSAMSKNAAQREVAETLQQQWAKKSEHPEWWFAMKTDLLLIKGKRDAAEALLRSTTFEGKQDTGRKIRLAMLIVGKNPRMAWNLLEQAYRIDPLNADVRSARAQMLEADGQIGAARVEYVAAWLSQTKNPERCNALAEFYRRSGSLQDAVQTWADGLKTADADFLWVKALFWSRVAHPTAFEIAKANAKQDIPPGNLRSFANYMRQLPEDEFRSDEAFNSLVSGSRLEATRQESYWLAVLDALKNNQEKRALHLIETSPFRSNSWNPALEHALDLILTYRQTGKLTPSAGTAGFVSDADHTFFTSLKAVERQSGAPSEELGAFLKGDNAYAAACLASGWVEAALRLYKKEKSGPDWMDYGIAQAYRMNRGDEAALTFIAGIKTRPAALELLRTEIQMNKGKIAEATPTLEKLASDRSDVGYRAAWMLALTRMNDNQFAAAAQAVQSQPALASSIGGKELLGRIKLAQGDASGAKQEYLKISDKSGEAKAFLARESFARGDYNTARTRTEELLRMYPDALELRSNLKRIDDAEGKK